MSPTPDAANKLEALILALLSLIALPACAETLAGRVVGVLDGDTITLLDASRQQYRIRLAEVDAPEKNQPFGQASKKSLSDLAYGREARAECPSTDRYGRYVCKVYVDGENVNAQQVARGLAWVYRQYAPKASPLYLLEAKARASNMGLWRDRNPTPPWEWRHAGN